MATLDYVIAKYLDCKVSEIQDKIQDSLTRGDVTNHLSGRRVITTYRNQKGCLKEFVFRDLTITSASETSAYNGFQRTTVEQHFYTRHGIKLYRAYNPCAVELCGKNMQHQNYYPLETLRLVPLDHRAVSENRRYLPGLKRRHFIKNHHFNERKRLYKRDHPNVSKNYATVEPTIECKNWMDDDYKKEILENADEILDYDMDDL